MIIQSIKFKTTLSENEVMAIAKERLPQFLEVPGLVQKYYIKTGEENGYGGVYVWDSEESMKAFRETDLAKSIPQAYKVDGAPDINISEIFITLRD